MSRKSLTTERYLDPLGYYDPGHPQAHRPCILGLLGSEEQYWSLYAKAFDIRGC